MSLRTADPGRILIIRLSAIGDNVMATPLICCLREAYPQAQIHWLCEALSAPLLDSHPDLAEVIVWPKDQWIRYWRSWRWGSLARTIWRFRAALRRRRFDLVIDAQGLLKSGILAWLSAAPVRVGLGSREGSQHLMTRVVARRHDHPLIGGEYHDLARAMGLPVNDFRLGLHLPPAAQAAAKNIVHSNGLDNGFVVLVPFTTRPQKHWVAARWPQLCSAVWREFHLPCIILGGPGDNAPEMVAAAGSAAPVFDFTGVRALQLTEAAAVIGLASAVVGVDTGMTHMASALQRPTVALFGSTVPYTEPLACRTRVLYQEMPCAPCRKHPSCNGAFTCMRDLGQRQVVDALREVLALA